jgi:hypothetical protein
VEWKIPCIAIPSEHGYQPVSFVVEVHAADESSASSAASPSTTIARNLS